MNSEAKNISAAKQFDTDVIASPEIASASLGTPPRNDTSVIASNLRLLRRPSAFSQRHVIARSAVGATKQSQSWSKIASSAFGLLAMTLFFIFPKSAEAVVTGLALGSNIKCDQLTITDGYEFNLNLYSVDIEGSGGFITVDQATVNANGSTFNIAGALNKSSTDTFVNGGGSITFDAQSGTHIINTGGDALVTVNVNASGATYTLNTNNLSASSLTVTAGTLDLAVLDLAVTGNLIVNGGTLDSDNINCDIDVNGNVTVSSGTLIAPAAADDTSFLAGSNWEVSGTGTFTHSSGRVVLDATSTGKTVVTTSSNADDFYQVKFNGSGGGWTASDAMEVADDFFLTNGTFTAPSTTLQVSGDFTKTGGTFTHNSGTVTFNGSGLQTLTGATFYNLTVNNTAASPDDNTDVDSSAAVTVTNTLNVNDGQFQPTTASSFKDITIGAAGILKPDASASITASGNLTLTAGGAFTHNNGTVNLGTAAQLLSGVFDNTSSSRFYNLTKNISAAAATTLTLENTGVYQVVNNLILKGASGKVLSLTSNDGTLAADFDVLADGTIDLDYLAATRIDSATGILMIATNSTATSCVNWDVGGAVGINFTWDGSSSTVWGTKANWDRGLIPLTASNVTIPSASNAPVFDAARTMNNLTIQTGGELSLNGYGLTLAGTTFSVEGTVVTGKLKLQGDEVIDFGAGGAAMDIDSGTFEYVGGGDATYTVDEWGATDYYNLIINKAAENFLLGGALTVAKDLTITAGTLDTDADGAGAGTTIYNATVKSNANFSGAFTARTSTVTLFNDGLDEIKTLTTGGNTFHHLTINHTAVTTNTARVSGALDVNGTLTLSDGTLDLDTNNVAVNVAGDVAIASGASVTPDQTGPWTFDGTTQNYTDSNVTKQNLGIIQVGT